MIDTMARCLGVEPLDENTLHIIQTHYNVAEHSIVDTSPFNQSWFNSFRIENGKNSNLVNKWNGSIEQRDFLRQKFKGRNITWGEKITEAKSAGIYKIIMDGVCYETHSLNKFANTFSLNAASLRNSLWNKKTAITKGRTVTVVLE